MDWVLARAQVAAILQQVAACTVSLSFFLFCIIFGQLSVAGVASAIPELLCLHEQLRYPLGLAGI